MSKELGIADDVAEDIATMYRNGDLLKVIQSKYPTVKMADLYGALRRHNVPKRGKGSGFKLLWERAHATGITPYGTKFDPSKPRKSKPAGGWPSKSKKAKAARKEAREAAKRITTTIAAKPAKIETAPTALPAAFAWGEAGVSSKSCIESPGIVLLQTLLERHLISQDDINTLALGGAIVSTATPVPAAKPKPQSTWARAMASPEPLHNEKYLQVVKLYKQNRLKHDEIAKLVGIGKSTVTRFAAIYRLHNPSK